VLKAAVDAAGDKPVAERWWPNRHLSAEVGLVPPARLCGDPVDRPRRGSLRRRSRRRRRSQFGLI